MNICSVCKKRYKDGLYSGYMDKGYCLGHTKYYSKYIKKAYDKNKNTQNIDKLKDK